MKSVTLIVQNFYRRDAPLELTMFMFRIFYRRVAPPEPISFWSISGNMRPRRGPPSVENFAISIVKAPKERPVRLKYSGGIRT